MRHLDVKQIYVQKLVAPDRVILMKEKGTENVADLGTKALDQWTIWKHIYVSGYRRLNGGKIAHLPEPLKRKLKNGSMETVAALVCKLLGAAARLPIAESNQSVAQEPQVHNVHYVWFGFEVIIFVSLCLRFSRSWVCSCTCSRGSRNTGGASEPSGSPWRTTQDASRGSTTR